MKSKDIHRGVGFGAGTEARGTPQNFSFPYAFVTEVGEDHWIANVHIINTGALSEEKAHRCLECPCTSEDEFDWQAGTINGQNPYTEQCNGQLKAEHNTRCDIKTYRGGLFCCESNELCLEESELPSEAPSTTFYLRYSVQYAHTTPEVRPLFLSGCCDATGDQETRGAVEYDIPKCDETLNPGCIHVAAARQSLGGVSLFAADSAEQDREVEIVYAVGHQHRGGLGISLYDDATGEMLCESLPTYGTEEGVIGNEKGYVVAMSTCTFNPPLRRRLSDLVRVVSLYDSTDAHTGTMGLFYIALADATQPHPEAATRPYAQVLELPEEAMDEGPHYNGPLMGSRPQDWPEGPGREPWHPMDRPYPSFGTMEGGPWLHMPAEPRLSMNGPDPRFGTMEGGPWHHMDMPSEPRPSMDGPDPRVGTMEGGPWHRMPFDCHLSVTAVVGAAALLVGAVLTFAVMKWKAKRSKRSIYDSLPDQVLINI